MINCDAHRVGGFEVARYGIATARRAWLRRRGANTRPWAEVAALRPRPLRRLSAVRGVLSAGPSARDPARRWCGGDWACVGGRCGLGPARRSWPVRGLPAPLDRDEPRQPEEAQHQRDEEVQPHPEDVVE